MAKKVKRSNRKLTEAELDRMRKIRAEVESKKDEHIAEAREMLERQRSVLACLKAAREDAGFSLTFLADRIGMDAANLSKLESAKGNPTISTLNKYAQALGKRLVLSLED